MTKQKTIVGYISMATVYGGNAGIISVLKQLMHSVYKREDSGKEILSIETLDLFINRRSVIQNFNFRNVNVWNNIQLYGVYGTRCL